MAQALDIRLSFAQELSLLLVLLLTSKGAAGVAGSGFITLAATLSATGSIPVAGLTLLLGIDRFMSEARALTNFVGNAVATLVVSRWEDRLDLPRARALLGPRQGQRAGANRGLVPVPEECRRDRVERSRWRSLAIDGSLSSSHAAFVVSPCCPGPRSKLAMAMRRLWGDGLDWVAEAHPRSAQEQRLNAAHLSSSSAAQFSPIPVTAEQELSEPRPRLNHTVTLGEIDVVATQSGAAPETSPGPTVIVNNYNQVNVATPALGYGSFGYARAPLGFSPGRVTGAPARSGASGPQPGQNWPAVGDHGPSFPYAPAPASPWTRQ